jgi:hypothetical protein
MSEKNTELVNWLKKAHQTCTTRLEKIAQENLLPEDRLQALQQKTQQLFNDFNRPELWIVTVNYTDEDKSLLLEHIVKLQSTGTDQAEAFEQEVDSLATFLRTSILPLARSWADSANSSQWNQQMRDELLRVRKTLREVKNKFASQGNDPDDKPEFVAADTRFHELLVIYWQKLTDNEVNTNEDQIDLMSTMREFIKSVTNVAKLIEAYKHLNAVIAENCGLPA